MRYRLYEGRGGRPVPGDQDVVEFEGEALPIHVYDRLVAMGLLTEATAIDDLLFEMDDGEVRVLYGPTGHALYTLKPADSPSPPPMNSR